MKKKTTPSSSPVSTPTLSVSSPQLDSSTESDVSPFFQAGEIVLAYHQNLLYEAKLLKSKIDLEKTSKAGTTVYSYFIHYQGWKDRWNEWVNEDRVMKVNPENLQLQTKVNEDYKKLKNSPKITPKNLVSPKQNPKRRRSERRVSSSQDLNLGNAALKFRVEFPEDLRNILIKDSELINDKKKLLSLPRNPSLTQIITEYVSQNEKNLRHSEDEDEEWTETLQGIQHYFNETVQILLLYKNEKKQYTDHFKQSKSFKDPPIPSNVYGFEHLLRLLVKLPELLARTEMEEESIVIIKSQVFDLLTFLQNNLQTWFSEKNYV